MKFIFLSGSFHSKSRSLAILKNIEIFFKEHDIELLNINELPFYSEDLNIEKPDIVKFFLATIESADGLVICTPEYNHSIPAVLKNALDWASRPAFHSVLKNKPVTIITQAVNHVGGARAQAHLKLVLDSTLSNIHVCHEMMITQANEIFDEHWILSDKKIMNRLERHITDFLSFTAHHNKLYK